MTGRHGWGSSDVEDDCTLYPIPSTAVILADLGPYLITLWAVVSIIVVVLYSLLIRTVIIVNQRAPKRWRRRIVWVVSIYPFMCLMSLASLVVPASDALLNGVGIIYMSIGVSHFLDLSILYFGGEARLLESVGEANLPLAVPPVCCCCSPCCPKLPLDKSGLRFMKVLVHQLPFTQSAYFVMTLYLFTAGEFVPGQGFPKSIFIPMTAFNIASFVSAMYGLSMFIRAMRGQLPEYHYRAKATLMKLTLIAVKFQELVFGICINFGAVSCGSVMPPKVNGEFIQNIVLVGEMVIFGGLAYWLYGRPGQYRSAAEYAAVPLGPVTELHTSSDGAPEKARAAAK